MVLSINISRYNLLQLLLGSIHFFYSSFIFATLTRLELCDYQFYLNLYTGHGNVLYTLKAQPTIFYYRSTISTLIGGNPEGGGR